MLKPMVKRGLFFIMEKGVEFFHNNPPKHSMAIYSCIVAKKREDTPKNGFFSWAQEMTKT